MSKSNQSPAEAELRKELKLSIAQIISYNSSTPMMGATEIMRLFTRHHQAYPNRPLDQAVGLLRQWLNEERIHQGRMVTNEELHHWLDDAVNLALLQKIEEAMPKESESWYSQGTMQVEDKVFQDTKAKFQNILNQAREGKL